MYDYPLWINLKKSAEHWDESRTAFKNRLVLHGETYRVEALFDTVPMAHDVTTAAYDDPRVRFSPSRDFCYMRRVLPPGTGSALPIADGRRRGHVWWTTDVLIPILANSKPVQVGGRTMADVGTYTWMSLTPLEFFTLRYGVQAAQGDVMIGGVGLGWLLGRVCAKDSVRRVRVVDLSPELVEWFRPAIERAYPAVVTKSVEWVVDDAWNHIDCFGADTCNLMDIWPNYADAKHDQAVKRVRAERNPKRLWCWGEDG